jgi:hypothetical protein
MADLDRPVAVPTEDDLRSVYELLQGATQALLDIKWRVDRIADQVDDRDVPNLADRTPTLEDIGALVVFKADVASRLEEMSDYVTDLTRCASTKSAGWRTMPSAQLGTLRKRGDRWTVLYRDAEGKQRGKRLGLVAKARRKLRTGWLGSSRRSRPFATATWRRFGAGTCPRWRRSSTSTSVSTSARRTPSGRFGSG